MNPTLPFDHHLPALHPAHFNEFAQVLVGEAPQKEDEPLERTLERVALAHRDLLLGQVPVDAWRAGERVWAALRVPTQEGDRWLDGRGRVFDSPVSVQAHAQAVLNASLETLEHQDVPSVARALEHWGLPQVGGRMSGFGPQVGVGIHLRWPGPKEGLDDAAEAAIVAELWQFSCHPFIGRAIVNDLREKGERFATVMPRVVLREWDNLRAGLARVGVEARKTWPMPSRGYREVPAEHVHVPKPLYPGGERPAAPAPRRGFSGP